ncbi:MAG: phosphatidylserine decarboxylase family protein [Bacteroidales bacterium]|uniref:phosphatidylserine decarboxylase family protein n=1 Tax=Candidatus Cryptobacteroides sp. TaxID=2952915 RepID=UPI002A75EFD8|nr:phosphatidylserine decarboxylase family protein [Candidatus Cryptobacteroides sp.]MCI6525706.1 phosphatidylserine decarboxylase family protein [Bacteroidales bacterium]MDD7233995.1 phosphatidylserine decarboxylase family protein [Bacteroidales bacterium]MDD7623850.1 phosphatidylserine decarboxylase family protein [Bacteroidales bacterium]MDY2702094.1 phosphatidylserine decarboxylase family protein [Candidatus Cryptobacteroides sp.]MDY3879471.1 phosphatidylserine decarboxylase family protein
MKLIRIDKDCHGTIVIAWVILACLIACVLYFSHSLWVQIPLITIFLLNAVFVFWFHRVPERTAPEGDDRTVTSVADGKVIIVEKVYEKEYFKEERIQVSVYMNFFDVHANFWPMDGQISYYKYHPGKYLLAFLPKASEKNEHATTVIGNSHGEVLFKQIAGTFARRIVCYSETGNSVKRAEQCGIIKFGSRIDMYFPLDADIKVKVGDLTRACETVIAELR